MTTRSLRRTATLLALALAAPLAAAPAPPPEQTLGFGPFGEVVVYGSPRPGGEVVLFVSGDGGWNLGVVDMARDFAALGHLVVGIDIQRYLDAIQKEPHGCLYPAADFEQLAQFVEQRLAFPAYRPPIVAGFSSGATLVYALLAQAPAATFRGGVSLGFCPDLLVRQPLCKGRLLTTHPDHDGKSVDVEANADLEVPWAVLQGEIDQVCDPAGTRAFAAAVPSAILYDLPHVGHGFSVPRNWQPQLRDALARVAAARPDAPPPAAPAVADLPLVELRATGAVARPELAVILSGDGGWAGLDKEVGGALAARGIPVVGWSSLQYFWRARTPDEAAADLGRALRHYLEAWGKERAILVGYSFGADVLPFLVQRLPADLRQRVAEVALLSPSTTAQFEFHVVEWIGHDASDAQPTAPAIAALAGLRLFCFKGEKESDSGCDAVSPALGETVIFPGGHHFAGAYEIVATRLLERLPALAERAP